MAKETEQERRERLAEKFTDDIDKWSRGEGAWPKSDYKTVVDEGLAPFGMGTYKVFASYEDYLNG